MKKIFIYTLLTVSLIACKKSTEDKPATETTYTIIVEAVENDGAITASPEGRIKIQP